MVNNQDRLSINPKTCLSRVFIWVTELESALLLFYFCLYTSNLNPRACLKPFICGFKAALTITYNIVLKDNGLLTPNTGIKESLKW